MCQYAVGDNGIRGAFVYAAMFYAADSAGDHFDRGRAYLQSGRFNDTTYYGDDVAMMVSVPPTLLIAESIINRKIEILFPIANSLINYGANKIQMIADIIRAQKFPETLRSEPVNGGRRRLR